MFSMDSGFSALIKIWNTGTWCLNTNILNLWRLNTLIVSFMQFCTCCLSGEILPNWSILSYIQLQLPLLTNQYTVFWDSSGWRSSRLCFGNQICASHGLGIRSLSMHCRWPNHCNLCAFWWCLRALVTVRKCTYLLYFTFLSFISMKDKQSWNLDQN